MKTTIDGQTIDENGFVEINASLPSGVVQGELEECLDYLGKREGLGAGASYDDMVVRFGERRANLFVAQWFMERCSFSALGSLGRAIVCDPELSLREPFEIDGGLSFTLRTFLLPKGTLSSYDPVRVSSQLLRPSDETIDAKLAFLADSRAEKIRIDRPARMGDVIRVNSRISCNSKIVDAYTREGVWLEMREGSMPERFLASVCGMRQGDRKVFSFEAPSRSGEGENLLYNADVTVIEVREKRAPKINDEWVRRNYPDLDDVAALRDAIAAVMADKAGSDFGIDAAVDKVLADRLEQKIPELISSFAGHRMEHDFKSELANRGISLVRYCEMEGISQTDFSMRMKRQAEEQIRRMMALDALFDEQMLVLSEKDIDEVVNAYFGEVTFQMKRDLVLSGRMYFVEEQARRNKVHKWLVDTAIVEDEAMSADNRVFD